MYKYARHVFPALNLKLMTIIRTTKMKCSLFRAIIQKDGLFYKGLETIYFSIFLDTENGLFAEKTHDICFWLFQQMDGIGDI